jgi:acetolactate synthase-1/2/3 large subunit
MAKISGAAIVVRALEDEAIPFAFGIPGAQNLELYDVLGSTTAIRPILVTDEQSASFMADGAWRVSGKLCCVNLVPGAGLTNALSGIAEAFMDGVPMLVLSCAIRSDIGKAFQLHDIDQLSIARPVTKGQFHVSNGGEIYSAIRRACALARRPPCGPVIVEIPADLLVFRHALHVEAWQAETIPPNSGFIEGLDAAITMIAASRRPLLYLGAGSGDAGDLLVTLAERLEVPVCTTIQGKGIFPEKHPLFLWCGFGPIAPPFVRSVSEEECDLTIAIGCRFAEVASGSYGLKPPGALIHVDVDRRVFDVNYPAALKIEANGASFVAALIERLPQRPLAKEMRTTIAAGRDKIRAEQARLVPADAAVSPPRLMSALQNAFGDGTAFVADSGNGLFEAMECLRLDRPRSFLAPVDFSCMGYALPAAIGAALAAPDRTVVALEGDGALLMTGLELMTASQLDIPIVVVVLRDRQLAQIAQFQRAAYVRKTCSDLADFDLAALCGALAIEHVPLRRNGDILDAIEAARRVHEGRRPVVVEAVMDERYRTYFTRGVVSTNLGRLPWGDRLRYVARALVRRLPGIA